ncbi:hypothetical protein PG991_008135 [Apiospora marii]|uniref:Transglycosylase SLT domain-containing protein n=1 Tax=Apiospora marii TaxID=335849 RepID=A0ABR1RVE6_9PEZI
MYASKLLLFVAAAVSASPLGSVVPRWSNSSTANSRHLVAREAPQFYSGPYTSFPGKETWKDFDTLWNANVPSMRAKGDQQSDIDRIKTALQSVGGQYGIEPRVLLSIMMQESHGDVGALTTISQPDGLSTGGLFQCWDCPGFYQQYGLSQAQITSMVEGGAKHFKSDLDQFGGCMDPKCVYPALRSYNSGANAVNQQNLSDAPNATPAYVSDIVQRLGGWVD